MKNNFSKHHCMVVYARYPMGETRVQREAEALIRHGYEVDVICVRTPGESAVDNHRGVQIYRDFCYPAHRRGELGGRFLRYFRFLISAAVRLTRLHRQRPWDTIQVHNLPDFLVFCALVPKLGGVPVILDLHDLMPEFYVGRFGHKSPLLARLIRWQERLACGFADHVITVSEHWRQALIERGVPAHKCSVVMNVADGNIFHRSEAGRSCLPDKDGFRLIYHGSVVRRYGLDLAIQAIDRVRNDIPNIHLTILGTGDYIDTLMQMVQELDLGNHVTIYRGIRPVEELPEIIRTAGVGIVPYRNDIFTDGLLPTKLMEYAALGLPAIAARTTAIESCFSDTMVEFFEPGDVDGLARCICKLYNNPERLAELAQGSEKFNQRYNWARIGAEYVALVKRLGSHSGPGWPEGT
jgi:glycosyltransferase involved in cell wall biosynthesis